MTGAHRFVWELDRGEPLGERFATHACDVKACVNPAHIMAGDQASNMRDMVLRGRSAKGDRHNSRTKPESVPRGFRHGSRTKPHRSPRGERNAAAKLTAAQVQEIRAAHEQGASYGVLFRRYGVDKSAIASIVHRRTWRHVA